MAIPLEFLNSTSSEEEAEPESSVFCITANCMQRQSLLKDKVIDRANDEIWCCAGFTYSQAIAMKDLSKKAEKSFEELVPPRYRKWKQVFSNEATSRLPKHQPWDHAIDFTPDAKPTWRAKVYPMLPLELEELDKWIDENLEKGYIELSKSPWAVLVFFIKKKDGKLCLIQDYCPINKITVKHPYPILLTNDLINRLQDAEYFTTLDICWGYHNIRIKEGHEDRAAFLTHRGLYRPKVMLFGLTNSPATFQSFMNFIFAPLIALGVVAVYLDDIVIYAKMLDLLREYTDQVFQILQGYDLFLCPSKCEFEKREIAYLGLIIRPGEVLMDPGKVDAICRWKTPENLKDVQAVLGFCNFYRRFCEDMAEIAQPLTELTKKNEPFIWTPVRDKAFEKLKAKFSEEPILKIYKFGLPTHIIINASNVATGGVLEQKHENNQWHLVTYCSSLMSKEERNYAIYNQEMLGLICALEDWQHFLEGLPEPFEVQTNHKNMEWWSAMQNLNCRQAR